MFVREIRLAGQGRRQTAGLAVLAAALGWLAGGASLAQLRMVPAIQEVVVPPGATRTFEVSLANAGKATLSCEMVARAMAISDQGFAIPAGAPVKRSCADWLSFVPERFALGPGEHKKVRVKLNAPPGEVGGYSALVACRAGVGSGATESQLKYELCSATLVVVKGGRLWAQIVPVEAEVTSGSSAEAAPSRSREPWVFTVTVENKGNLHTQVGGEVAIRTPEGRTLWSGALRAGKGFVLAESPRTFTASGTDALPDGEYIAVATMSTRASSGRQAPLRVYAPFAVVSGEVVSGEPSEDVASLLAQCRARFFVEPEHLELAAPPGGTRTGMIRVRNLTSEALELQAELYGCSQRDDGTLVYSRPADGAGAAAWVRLDPSRFSVPPQGEGRLKVTLQAPRGAAGEHCAAVVFAEASDALADTVEWSFGTVSRVTCAAAGTGTPRLEVRKFEVSHTEGGKYVFTVGVANEGDVAAAARGAISVLDESGNPVSQRLGFGPQDCQILGGAFRAFSVEWPRVLDPGEYTASLVVSYGEGQRTDPATFRFRAGTDRTDGG